MVDGKGLIYSAANRSQINALQNDVVKAAWNASDGQLFTLKKPSYTGPSYDPVWETVTRVQRWAGSYALEAELEIAGVYTDLWIHNDQVVVATSRGGIPSITTLNPDFTVVPPSELATPLLSVDGFSATAASLVWSDVIGEETSVIEGRTAGDTNWMEVGRAPLDATNHLVAPLVSGNQYEFRIKAVNTSLASDYSSIVVVDLRGTNRVALDPRMLAFVPDDVLIATNDLIYLLSASNHSIFVWDPRTGDWTDSIPLRGEAENFTYSPENNAIYTLYSDGVIASIGLAASNPVEIDFANLPGPYECGLLAAGEFVVACDASSTSSSSTYRWHRSYDAAGRLISSERYRNALGSPVWSPVNRSFYYLYDYYSSRYRGSGIIDTNGVLGQASGMSSSGLVAPLRVDPTGRFLVGGANSIYDAATLGFRQSLPFAIDDAFWQGTNMLTLSSNRVYSHTGSNYSATLTASLGARTERVFPLSVGGFVAISVDVSFGTRFELFDSNWNLVPPANLTVPSNLGWSLLSSNSVQIGWSDVGGELGYRVERSIDGGTTWSTNFTTQVNVTSGVDSNAVLGATLTYRVIAFHGQVESTPSQELIVDLNPPAKPTNIVATVNGGYEVTLCWDPVARVDGYVLAAVYLTNGVSRSIATHVPGDVTCVTNRGLSPDTQYTFGLFATNAVGVTVGDSVTAHTDGVLPYAPYLNVPIYSSTSVSLTWFVGFLAETYFVERSNALSGWQVIATNSAASLNYTDRVNPDDWYAYRVKSANATGESDYSIVRLVYAPPLPEPAAPLNLIARGVSTNLISVSWLPAVDAGGYRLERSETGLSWNLLASVSSNIVSYADSNVVAGREYFYRVEAFNQVGNSPFSNTNRAVAAPSVFVLEDDFDPGYDSNVWSRVSGAFATNGGAGFNGSQALWFGGGSTREARTVPIDATAGLTVHFKIRAGDETRYGGDFWNNSEAGETVDLQYTTNGATWHRVQTLNTVYPSLTNWTDTSIELLPIPGGTNTSLRWIQSSNNGGSYDAWAIDDLSVELRAASAPSVPPFLIASAVSATDIGLFWAQVPEVNEYVLERTTNGASWAVIAVLDGELFYHTDQHLLPSTYYSYRLRSRRGELNSDPSITVFAKTISPLDDWRLRSFGSTDAGTVGGLDQVDGNGVPNLVRYAFNLSANDPMAKVTPGTGTAGTPLIFFDKVNGRLCIELVRRRADLHPEIGYHVEFCDKLGLWTPAGTVRSVSPIDSLFERVVWEDEVTRASANSRFGRVRISSDE